MNFYPRSPCGERLFQTFHFILIKSISIHALLAESDRERAGIKPIFSISIHALLAESDQVSPDTSSTQCKFLSTLSLRRATLAGPSGPAFLFNFYPRSPCGERLLTTSNCFTNTIFLSTLSLRRATRSKTHNRHKTPISIHALLAESDGKTVTWDVVDDLFLSTLSLRRATWIHHARPVANTISIHALLAESDPRGGGYTAHFMPNFYPRSPCGERHSNFTQKKHPLTISIHALLAESDTMQIEIVKMHALFLSTLSLRRATNGHG